MFIASLLLSFLLGASVASLAFVYVMRSAPNPRVLGFIDFVRGQVRNEERKRLKSWLKQNGLSDQAISEAFGNR